jgi:hypothetical protein
VPGPTYSTRFMVHAALEAEPQSLNYVVPAGKRAVIKSVVAFNGGAAAALVSLRLAGSWVWSASVPGGSNGVSADLFMVAYAGESLELYLGAPNMGGTCSGYLLMDP